MLGFLEEPAREIQHADQQTMRLIEELKQSEPSRMRSQQSLDKEDAATMALIQQLGAEEQ